jgi:phosphoglycolate phosphatase
MIKAVTFDLDGTLVDAYSAVSRSVNYTLTALGFSRRSFAEIKRSVGGGDVKLVAHFVGAKLAPRALALYRSHHAKALRAKGGVKLLPGVGPMLKFLKQENYKLAIASNRPTQFTRIILKELGLLPFFKVVLCADRAPKPKPYPDMLWAIAERLNLENKEVLYVGDMTIDIKCGHAAGMRVVAVSTGSSTKKELKDLKPWVVIDKMKLLKPIVMEGKE